MSARPLWEVRHYDAGKPREQWCVFQWGCGEHASCTSYASAASALRLLGGEAALVAYEKYMLELVGRDEWKRRTS